ncbi:uncharacterized protein LOC130892772 [Diorhabda carinulata]|uniref:uncharacterized protein LOC130892772 n=1 Tax=Diorhabda carinulata TaxID=1163345 RepID=UPI0025A2F9E0|nr:uncharacterized protein LOC130892772 [Diorhabda carinulata]XP_057654362.1 uncharacterized protein LOC130892772 [Diorhabda carinulata]XP_057654363.1 uncharacterized protein LOC130892772 [Diorhabda carinulata]
MYALSKCQSVNAARFLLFNKMYASKQSNEKFMKRIKGLNWKSLKLLRTIFVNSMWLLNATELDCIKFSPKNNCWLLFDGFLKPTWFLGDSTPTQVKSVLCDSMDKSSDMSRIDRLISHLKTSGTPPPGQKHEPVQYALLQGNRKSEKKILDLWCNMNFSGNTSRKILISHSVMQNLTRVKNCIKMINQIDGAYTETERDRLKAEKSLHVAKAETFYEQLKLKSELSKTTAHMEVITFDYQQNFPLPVSSSGEVLYKIQMWVYNFCIHVASTGISYFFLYDETISGNGQNEVISHQKSLGEYKKC